LTALQRTICNGCKRDLWSMFDGSDWYCLTCITKEFHNHYKFPIERLFNFGDGYLQCTNEDCGYADVPNEFIECYTPFQTNSLFNGLLQCTQCDHVDSELNMILAYSKDQKLPDYYVHLLGD
jgi:hypothetical protein